LNRLLNKGKDILQKHGLWMLFAAVLTCAVLAMEDVAEAAIYRSKKEMASGPAAEITDGYLNGAELDLLKSQSDGQMSSSVIVSPSGGVIVVDGGRAEDEQHLVDTINAHGGRVSLWLITHPHDDHLGALTKILDSNPRPVQIDTIVYSFLSNEDYQRGENQGRMSNLTDFQKALKNAGGTRLENHPAAGTVFTVGDDAKVTVMNEPFYADRATFNNSSVVYKVETGGRTMLFLGDLSKEGADALLAATADKSTLKADILQMAHHGSGIDGAGDELYSLIRSSVCLWPTPTWMWNAENDGYGVNALEKKMAAWGCRKDVRCDTADGVLR
jgi:hypothetical protein